MSLKVVRLILCSVPTHNTIIRFNLTTNFVEENASETLHSNRNATN